MKYKVISLISGNIVWGLNKRPKGKGAIRSWPERVLSKREMRKLGGIKIFRNHQYIYSNLKTEPSKVEINIYEPWCKWLNKWINKCGIMNKFSIQKNSK